MIIKGFNENQGGTGMTTLINEEVRGNFGDYKYRGNYAGGVLIKLVNYLKAIGISEPYLFDPMVGGGTTKDVAEFLKLPYVVDDIHNGFDVVNDSWHDIGFDLTMLHFPYWKMIDYASNLPKEIQNKDMSRMEWKEFIEAVSHVNYRAAAHSKYVAVLVGDMAYKGGIKSIQREMAWIGQPIRHIIKVQNNAMSYKKDYNCKFIPIITEHLLLFKTDYKENMEIWTIDKAKYKKVDIEPMITWETAIMHIMQDIKRATAKEILKGIEERFPVKLKKTNTPEATIRRTFQILLEKGKLERINIGEYEIAA